MTYDQLFAILRRLGFRAQERGGDASQGSQVYIHGATNTVLLFRDSGQRAVSPADLLSTEMRLQSHGITGESLESLSQLSDPMHR